MSGCAKCNSFSVASVVYYTHLLLYGAVLSHFGVKVENAPAKCKWQTGSEGTDNNRSCTQR